MSRRSSSFNPFVNGEAENFPPLSDTFFESQQEDQDDEGGEQTVQYYHQDDEVELDYSIDTLARVKPVEMSNMSTFFNNREREEQEEQEYQKDMEQEDHEYFLRKEPDVTPQKPRNFHKAEISTQTSLTISPKLVCQSCC